MAAPIVGSLIVVVAMALFTVIVFRTVRAWYPLVPGGNHCLSPAITF